MFFSIAADVLLLVAGMVATASALYWIEKRWPASSRMQHNEIIGWQINVFGTIYAIILGFMLYNTWAAFQTAKQNAGGEATALVNVARLGRGLPQPQSAALWSEARDYASIVVNKEWPAMQHDRFAPESHIAIERMWATLISVQPQTPAQQAALGQAWSEISILSNHRRMRRIEMTDSLPGIMWVVLDTGGVLLLLFGCLFGSRHRKLHLFLVLSLAFMLSLLLLTVAGIDRPFQGWLHVPVEAFQGAAETLDAP